MTAPLISCQHIHEVVDERNFFSRHRRSILIGTGVTVACAAVPPLALYAAGFTGSGVAAGSAAALWQSSIGNVAAGSLFATCQSLGATVAGTYITASAGVGVGWTTAGTGWGISKFFQKNGSSEGSNEMMGNNILIDLDGLEDDGRALFLLLEAHKNPQLNFNIVGITISNLEPAAQSADLVQNSLLMNKLEEAESIDIPLYNGSEYRWRGIQLTTKEYAAKGKVTIVTFGSLTSLAKAIRETPEIKDMVNGVLITGENRQAGSSEFNPFVDIEAANKVLLGFHPTPLFLAHRHVCTEVFKDESTSGYQDCAIWPLTDSLLAAAMLIEPAMATTRMLYNAKVTVEPIKEGQAAQPMMIVDRIPDETRNANLVITLECDLNVYRRLLRWAVETIPFI